MTKESLNLNIFSLEHLFWIVQTWGQQNDDHDDESDYDDDDDDDDDDDNGNDL